jgi:hypothetical protein
MFVGISSVQILSTMAFPPPTVIFAIVGMDQLYEEIYIGIRAGSVYFNKVSLEYLECVYFLH